jgi:hypothetical protein
MAGRLGPPAFSEAALREALELNPDASPVKGLLATLLAIHSIKLPEALELANAENAEWSRFSAQAMVYWAMKRVAESDAALKLLIDKLADIAAVQVAEAYSVRNEPDKAFEWLERAYRQHDGGIGWIVHDDALVPLHGDPRWPAFLKKIHCSDPEPS